MFKFIKKLQSKPDSYKRKVSFLSSLGLTLIIIIVWLTTLFSGITRISNNNDTASVEDARAPIESLKSTLSSTIVSIKKLFEAVD